MVISNAFRKKSYLPQPQPHAFVEERNQIIESRKQIVEVFIETKDSIKMNERLLRLKDTPIVADTEVAQLTELSKPSTLRSNSKRMTGNAVSRSLKA